MELATIFETYQNSPEGCIKIASTDLNSAKINFLEEECEKNVLFLNAGIDEAGRGPVLGPMVYALFVCKQDFESSLKLIGVNDSKKISESKRFEIFSKLLQTPQECAFFLYIIKPKYISNSMLDKVKYDLNAMSHVAAGYLVAKSSCIFNKSLKNIFVDTVGTEATYEKKLEKSLITEGITKITVKKKADSFYKTVSAASICAKVSRDYILEKLIKIHIPSHLPVCSGYPADENTVRVLNSVRDVLFGFDENIFRFSWKTMQNVINKRVLIVWDDVDENKNKRKRKSLTETKPLVTSSLMECFNMKFSDSCK